MPPKRYWAFGGCVDSVFKYPFPNLPDTFANMLCAVIRPTAQPRAFDLLTAQKECYRKESRWAYDKFKDEDYWQDYNRQQDNQREPDENEANEGYTTIYHGGSPQAGLRCKERAAYITTRESLEYLRGQSACQTLDSKSQIRTLPMGPNKNENCLT
jgi:hypothetical protein